MYQIKSLCYEQDVSSEDLRCALLEEWRKEADEAIRDKVMSMKGWEGRYFVEENHVEDPMFPAMKKYYKVVSVRSENPYRVECLTFPEVPFYWFDYKDSRVDVPGNWFLGSFRYDGPHTESVMLNNVQQMTAISEEEYASAMREYTERLLKMSWVPDHAREGGKFPDDPAWNRG